MSGLFGVVKWRSQGCQSFSMAVSRVLASTASHRIRALSKSQRALISGSRYCDSRMEERARGHLYRLKPIGSVPPHLPPHCTVSFFPSAVFLPPFTLRFSSPPNILVFHPFSSRPLDPPPMASLAISPVVFALFLFATSATAIRGMQVVDGRSPSSAAKVGVVICTAWRC